MLGFDSLVNGSITCKCEFDYLNGEVQSGHEWLMTYFKTT